MRVFVIGATGYIGSHTAREFRDGGHDVRGFSRSEDSDCRLREMQVQPVRGDLDDRASLREAALDADVTIFAARVLEPSETRAHEHRIVSALVEDLHQSGKTFIFTSGTGVVGQFTGGEWSETSFAEDDAFVPPESLVERVFTETRVRAAAQRGVRAIVVRPPLIWGNDLPSHMLHMYRSALLTGSVCYMGRGLNSYTNVHVEDLAALYRLAAEKGVAGALYHCTDGEVPNRWIAEKIGGVLGLPTRSIDIAEATRLWGGFNARSVMGSCSRSRSPRARAELGWRPTRHDMIEELERLIARVARDKTEEARILRRRPGAAAGAIQPEA